MLITGGGVLVDERAVFVGRIVLVAGTKVLMGEPGGLVAVDSIDPPAFSVALVGLALVGVMAASVMYWEDVMGISANSP